MEATTLKKYLLVKNVGEDNVYYLGAIESSCNGADLARLIFQQVDNPAYWGSDLVLGGDVYREVQTDWGWTVEQLKVTRVTAGTGARVTFNRVAARD